jgi:hypothetical protein
MVNVNFWLNYLEMSEPEQMDKKAFAGIWKGGGSAIGGPNSTFIDFDGRLYWMTDDYDFVVAKLKELGYKVS